MHDRPFTSIMLNAILFFSFSLLCSGVMQAQPGDQRTPKQIEKELKEKLARENEYIRKNPNLADYYDDRGEVYMEFYARAKQLSKTQDKRASYAERAFADFDKAIELTPHSGGVYLMRAKYRQWLDDWLLHTDEAIADYVEAFFLYKMESLRQHPIPSYAEEDSRLAQYYLELSYVYLNRAQTLSMTPAMIRFHGYKPEQLAEFRLQHPQYSLLNDLDAVIEYTRKAMANAELAAIYDPWLVSGNFMLKGNAAAKLKEYKIALDAYDSAEAYWNKRIDIACERIPSPCSYNTNFDEKIFSYSLSFSRAKVYLKLKKPQKALAEFNYYLSDGKNAQCSRPFFLRAIAYWMLGQDELAEADEKQGSELPKCGDE